MKLTGLLGNHPILRKIFFVFSPLLFKIKLKTVFKGRDWLDIVVELRLQYCPVQKPENCGVGRRHLDTDSEFMILLLIN